jgi:DNA-binding NtrC family response regulator
MSPVVLIVEDEFLIRVAAVDIARAAGFAVVEAANAAEAVHVLESRSDIRLVFTDIDMPGSMDGLGLASLVRDRWPVIEVVVTSGKMTPALDELPPRSRFFPKPYAHSELRSVFQSFAQRMTGYVEREPRYWQDRAEEARARASEMRHASAVVTMSEIAHLYDRMAEQAAHSERDTLHRSSTE